MLWDALKVTSKIFYLSKLLALLLFPLEHLALPLYWKGAILRCLMPGCLCSCSIRSGVGAADVLQRNNITQVVDLPGVGEHYMGEIYNTRLFNVIDGSLLKPC